MTLGTYYSTSSRYIVPTYSSPLKSLILTRVPKQFNVHLNASLAGGGNPYQLKWCPRNPVLFCAVCSRFFRLASLLSISQILNNYNLYLYT